MPLLRASTGSGAVPTPVKTRLKVSLVPWPRATLVGAADARLLNRASAGMVNCMMLGMVLRMGCVCLNDGVADVVVGVLNCCSAKGADRLLMLLARPSADTFIRFSRHSDEALPSQLVPASVSATFVFPSKVSQILFVVRVASRYEPSLSLPAPKPGRSAGFQWPPKTNLVILIVEGGT